MPMDSVQDMWSSSTLAIEYLRAFFVERIISGVDLFNRNSTEEVETQPSSIDSGKKRATKKRKRRAANETKLTDNKHPLPDLV